MIAGLKLKINNLHHEQELAIKSEQRKVEKLEREIKASSDNGN